MAPKVLRGVDRVSIGECVAIYPGVWLQVESGSGSIEIANHVYIGHDVHIHSVDPITVGERTFIVDGVYIGSADHDRDTRSLVVGSGPVKVGRDVFIGQRAVILGGVTIGDGATIGAHAVVTHDVAPGSVVGGVPARPITSKEPHT